MHPHYYGSNFDTLYRRIIDHILSPPEAFKAQGIWSPVGAPRGDFLEIQGLTMVLSDPRNRMIFNGVRNVNYEFAMKLFSWVLSGSSDSKDLQNINPNASNYLDKDATGNVSASFDTAYGPRIMEQLYAAMDELERDPGSRRATVMILDKKDRAIWGTESKTEYPCTMGLVFSVRNKKLHLHTTMRSNNMVLTFVYDVFLFTMLQEWAFQYLSPIIPGLKLGNYIHHAVSAHIYASQVGLAQDILRHQEPGTSLGPSKPKEQTTADKPSSTVAGTTKRGLLSTAKDRLF